MSGGDSVAEVARILKCKAQDFFAVLDIDPKTAEFDEVKKAHKRVVLKVHPDKCQGVAQAKDAFAVADAAYKKLSDEAMFTRFRDAFRRKADAQKAAMDLAAGKVPARAEVDDAAEAERQRQEKYLAAVREHKEFEAKRNRVQNERRANAEQQAVIDEQLEHFKEMKRVFGTTDAAAVAAKARAAAATSVPVQGGAVPPPAPGAAPFRPLGKAATKRPVQR